MKRVDRYVLAEVLVPFAGGVALFLGLIIGLDLMQKIFYYLLRYDLPLGTLFVFILYNVPRLVAYVLPMAVMFGTLTAVGRLSSDAELDAINAGGIGFRRMSLPIIAFGALVSVVTFVLNECVVPGSNNAATELVLTHVKKVKSGRYFMYAIPEQTSGFPLSAIITAATFDPERRELTNVCVVQFDKGQPVMYLEASEARWEGNELVADFTWTQRKPGSTVKIESSPRVNIGVPPILAIARESKPQDMTLRELREHVEAVRSAARVDVKEALRYLTELHMRIAGPFCALAFALVGAPLGIRPQRSTAGLNLGMSVVIIFLYYIFVHATTMMAKSGQLAPWLGAWIGNIVVFVVGGYLFWRVFR